MHDLFFAIKTRKTLNIIIQYHFIHFDINGINIIINQQQKMAKRSRQPKYRQEEEEEYAESETGFPSADDESDEDLLGVREEELVPVVPKKRNLTILMVVEHLHQQ